MRLSLWEWFKLRRRWMPWILLAILVLFPQIGAVGSYFIYRGDISDGTFGVEAEYGFEITDEQGRTTVATFTCADLEGGGDSAIVGGASTGGEREPRAYN